MLSMFFFVVLFKPCLSLSEPKQNIRFNAVLYKAQVPLQDGLFVCSIHSTVCDHKCHSCLFSMTIDDDQAGTDGIN